MVAQRRARPLAARLDDANTTWQRVQIARWYGEGNRVVEIASDTAVWYHTGSPPVSIRWVLIRDPLGKFAPQALLSTDMQLAPLQMLEWLVQRWQLEVTFEEVRAHLGVETQRQWSDLAPHPDHARLLGLFSLVTLLAHEHWKNTGLWVRRAAWYDKTVPTFVDALAEVRRALYTAQIF